MFGCVFRDICSQPFYILSNSSRMNTINTLIGVLLQSGGGYLLSEAIRKETSMKNGAALFLSGSLIQLIGFLQIGEAGNEFKKSICKDEKRANIF